MCVRVDEDHYVIVKIGFVPHFVLTVGLGGWVMGSHSFLWMGLGEVYSLFWVCL